MHDLASFYQGKRVFITGHTGFKGSWLTQILVHWGAIVKGYSLEPEGEDSHFISLNLESKIDHRVGDIRDGAQLQEAILEFQPEIVIHLAAQALVRESYKNPVDTFSTNVMGFLNLLEVIKVCDSVSALVYITSDKCYENFEWVWGYRETDPMGGFDPYSSSKGCAELVAASYRNSFLNDLGIGVASARAGNVIGGGDWAKDRLIPDILKSFELDEAVTVRNPNATRPWQHVLEPLSGYLLLAQKLYDNYDDYSEGWNFGPDEKDVKPVHWILDKMISYWPNAHWKLDEDSSPHEANFLKLNISKARSKLDWRPIWELDRALERIINWHKAWKNNEDIQLLCLAEIKEYMKDMNK